MSSEIQVTDAVFSRVQKIIEVEGTPKMLRVAVLGGGCSGFQYKFELEEQINNDDQVFEKDGIKVLIDEISVPFLEGSIIDFKDEMIGAHFAIDNPNATSSCGCGTSFSF